MIFCLAQGSFANLVPLHRLRIPEIQGIGHLKKSVNVTNPRILVTNVITLPVLFPLFLAEKKDMSYCKKSLFLPSVFIMMLMIVSCSDDSNDPLQNQNQNTNNNTQQVGR